MVQKRRLSIAVKQQNMVKHLVVVKMQSGSMTTTKEVVAVEMHWRRSKMGQVGVFP